MKGCLEPQRFSSEAGMNLKVVPFLGAGRLAYVTSSLQLSRRQFENWSIMYSFVPPLLLLTQSIIGKMWRWGKPACYNNTRDDHPTQVVANNLRRPQCTINLTKSTNNVPVVYPKTRAFAGWSCDGHMLGWSRAQPLYRDYECDRSIKGVLRTETVTD